MHAISHVQRGDVQADSCSESWLHFDRIQVRDGWGLFGAMCKLIHAQRVGCTLTAHR